MSMGMGIAGFVQGLRSGIEAREGMEDRRERRLDRAEAREARALDRRNTAEVAAIGARANEDIAAGQPREEVEARYWREIQDAYAAQGRPDLARQFHQFIQSDDGRRGVRHFQNGMMLFEMARRPDGAYDPNLMRRGLGELQRAQRLTGYGGDRDFQFRPIVEGEGENERVIGYRIGFKGDDGQTVERDIQPGEIPRAAAMMFNPQSAFEDRRKQDEQRRAQAETRRGEERGDWQKAEEQVRKEYEERRVDPMRRETTPMRPWQELSTDEQDDMIRGRMSSRTPPTQRSMTPGLAGGPAAPRGRTAFDTLTGRPAGPAPAAAAPALSAPPAGAPASAVPAVPAPSAGPGSTTGSATAAIMAPPQVTQEANRNTAIREGAERALQQGENPDHVAAGLQRAGIPLDAWPESLQAGVLRRQQGAPTGRVAPGISVYGAPR